MTDQQQSGFRFRIPRLRPPVPPPRTTTTTTTRTTPRRPPVRPLPQPSIRPQGTPPAPPPASPPTPTPRPQKPTPLQEPPPTSPPTPTLRQQELPAPTPRPQELPATTQQKPPPGAILRQQEPPAPTPQPQKLTPSQEPSASPPTPTLRQQESPAPTSRPQETLAKIRQEPPASPPTSTLRQQEPPSKTPQEPPASPSTPTMRQQEPPAKTPQQPPASPPTPTLRQQESPSPTPRPQEPPATTPLEPPTSPPIPPLGEPSPSQLEPLVQTSSPREETQPFSPSQPSKVKMPAETYSNNTQKSTDYATYNEEDTSMELRSLHSNTESHTEENQLENQEVINFPNSPQTKSVISHPNDKILVPKSLESRKQSEETPPNQTFNEKPAIITLAGDNRGPIMRIGTGKTKRETSIHIYRRYKVNPDDTMTDDDEEDEEEEKENDSKANENEENFPYINCNIQGINNSMVFNCSITERSPGVHFGSCDREHMKKPKRKFIKSTNMNRLKVNSTPLQKHTIRRRCLRGLFMESSDSHSNDPQKPRRHGCRYIGEDKSNKDDKMDAV